MERTNKDNNDTDGIPAAFESADFQAQILASPKSNITENGKEITNNISGETYSPPKPKPKPKPKPSNRLKTPAKVVIIDPMSEEVNESNSNANRFAVFGIGFIVSVVLVVVGGTICYVAAAVIFCASTCFAHCQWICR